MLCRKILLSGSAAKTSLQPNAAWCQKSLKHFSARGIHHAERLALFLHQKYYPAWTSDPFTVSLGDDGIHMGPIILFFFFSLSYYSGLIYAGETLPEHTCTFLAKVRSRSVTQICTGELPNPNRVFGEKWEFKTLLKRTVILKC